MSSYFVNGYLALNILLSIGIVWICVCRISVMDKTTRPMFRFAYVLIATAAVANGCSRWFFNEQVGMGTLLMTLALLWQLCSSARVWRRGVPSFGRTGAVDLDEAMR